MNQIDPNIPAPQNAPHEVTDQEIQNLIDGLSRGRPVQENHNIRVYNVDEDLVPVDMPVRTPQSEEMAPGLKREQELRTKWSFTEAQIKEYRDSKIAKYKENGYTDEQINEHFGIKQPDTAALSDTIKTNLQAALAEEQKPGADGKPKEQQAKTLYEAFEAGFQGSVDGLILRGKNPDLIVPEDAGFLMHLVSTAGYVSGDLPAMIGGAKIGASVGATAGGVGGLAFGGVGAIPAMALGGVVGGTGGAWAAPAMIREALMQHYAKGDIVDSRDFAARTMQVLYEGSKGFVTGLATELVGGKAGMKVLEKTGSKLLSESARFFAELPTMVTMGRALEGQLPNRMDFLTGGVIMGGFHGARVIAPKLMTLYNKEGARPELVAKAASEDVLLKQEIIAEDSGIAPYAPRAIEKPPTFKEMARDFINSRAKSAHQTFFDSIAPLKDLKDEKFSYMLADSQKNWNARANYFVEYGTIDAKRNQTGEAYRPVVEDGLKAVKGRDLTPEATKILENMPETSGLKTNEEKLLDIYLASQTAVERAKKTPDKPTGIDIEAAQKFMKDHPELKEVGKRYTKFFHRVVDYGVGGGIISEEAGLRMKTAHEFYAPLGREVEVDPLTGRGNKGGPFKKFKGSENAVRSPVLVGSENISAIVRAVEENQTRLSIKKALEKNPDPTIGRIEKAPSKSTTIEFQEVQDILEKRGFEDVEMPGGTFQVWRKQFGPLKENQVPYFENGKMGVMSLREDIAAGLKSLDYDPMFSSIILNDIARVAFGSASLAKKSITMAPAFAERNMTRDQIERYINEGGTAVLPTVEAWGDILGKSDEYKRYLLSGGLTEGFYGFKDYAVKWDVELRKQQLNENIWNTIKSPIQAARVYGKMAAQAYPDFLNKAELAPRVASAKAHGLMNGDFESLIKAGYESKESTVNFMRSGLQMRAFSKLFKFLSPGLAGLERNVRGLSDAQVWERGFYALTVPTYVNWMTNRDQSWYKSLPPYMLATGIPFYIDDWQPAVNNADFMSRPEDMRRERDGRYEVNNGTVHYIAKPQGLYSLLFSTIPESVLNKFYGTNPEAFRDFDEKLLGAFLPDMSVNVALPFFEKWANKNVFTGNPIVPEYLRKSLPQDQWTAYTSETAKQLGKLMGAHPTAGEINTDGLSYASPMVIDTFIRDMTGPVGVFVVKQVDKALHMAGIGNQSPPPLEYLSENNFINGFIHRFPNARVQDIERFYRRYSESELVNASFNAAMKGGDQERVSELLPYKAQFARLSGAREAISRYNKLIQAVVLGSNRPDMGDFSKMTPAEKRQMIQTTYFQMWQVAQDANRQMDFIEQQVKAQREGNFGP